MKVVTFGEALFRTATRTGERLTNASQLNFYLGGSELNVAANLQALNIESAWVSALPAGPTGDLIREKVKQLGVDISHCTTLVDNHQIGWYLMESGANPRPDVVFHRNASGMGQQKEFSFDWQSILSHAALFHTSGITAGLSSALTQEIKTAMAVAKKNRVLISYDLNYRKHIWSLADFVKRQHDMFAWIDILFCSVQDLKLFFHDDVENNHFEKVFAKSNIQYLVLVQRNQVEQTYGIEIITSNQRFKSQLYPFSVIDRIGIGDSAAAGFIKQFLQHHDVAAACEWAALAGALKYGIKGDMALLKEHDLTRTFDMRHHGVIR